MNQEKETEISLSKQNVRAVLYLVGRERHKQVDTELGGSASGFDGFKEIMESYLLLARCEAQMSVNDVSGRSHLWGFMFQVHGTESGDYNKQFYIMLLGGMISIIKDVRLCDDCQFCNTIREVRG
jgi:hypothetical protein